MVGTTVEEAIGKKCWDLFDTDLCKTKACGIQRAISDNSTITEQSTARINGMEKPLKVTSVSIKDAKGNVKGGLEYSVDVTAESKVEALINTASDEVETLVSDSLTKMDEASRNMEAMNKLIEKEVQALDESSSTVDAMLITATAATASIFVLTFIMLFSLQNFPELYSFSLTCPT